MPLTNGSGSWIRIRIHPNMSWIRNTAGSGSVRFPHYGSGSRTAKSIRFHAYPDPRHRKRESWMTSLEAWARARRGRWSRGSSGRAYQPGYACKHRFSTVANRCTINNTLRLTFTVCPLVQYCALGAVFKFLQPWKISCKTRKVLQKPNSWMYNFYNFWA
jgi:hypothetical protein